MNSSVTKRLAWVLVVAAVALQFPLQESIDRYRNTIRVIMYPDARDTDIAQAQARFTELGLQPKVVSARGADGRPTKAVLAPLPRAEWSATHEKYIRGLHSVPRVNQVVAGINEQGIPLDQVQQLNIQDVGIIVMAALIGGFRKSAANVLWLQNEENWHSGKGYRTIPLARAVTMLDPNFVDAWVLTCWHLAYNMSVEAKSPDEAASLIAQGLKFAEEGIPWNSTTYEIYQEIGWTYYDKLQNYERAAEYMKQAIEHRHPTYLERMIAHSYERLPEIDKALKWYHVSQQKYGEADQTARGAIETITERYLNAWQLFRRGDYDGAERQLESDWTAACERCSRAGRTLPSSTIYLHFRARIAEARASAAKGGERAKLYEQAFSAWMAAAKENPSDRLARRRVLTLADNFGWKDRVPKGYNDVGLPENWAKDLAPEQRGRSKPAPAPAKKS